MYGRAALFNEEVDHYIRLEYDIVPVVENRVEG